eukprot:3851964-Pleurochrysis_carterae.AAC.1
MCMYSKRNSNSPQIGARGGPTVARRSVLLRAFRILPKVAAPNYGLCGIGNSLTTRADDGQRRRATHGPRLYFSFFTCAYQC